MGAQTYLGLEFVVSEQAGPSEPAARHSRILYGWIMTQPQQACSPAASMNGGSNLPRRFCSSVSFLLLLLFSFPSHDRFQKWTKGLDLFDKKIVLFPINSA